MRFLNRAARSAAAILFVLTTPFAAYAATASSTSQAPLTLSIIRAIRISDSTISLTFKTNVSAVGILRYTTTDGGDITLTDSAPEVDHLFTIDTLDPRHGYTFIMKADTGKDSSNTYNVLLAPDSIGPVGASEMPGFQVTNEKGTVIASTLSASSTSTQTGSIPLWAYVTLIGVVAVGYGIYRFMTRNSANESENEEGAT
jgi:hypothetical protein